MLNSVFGSGTGCGGAFATSAFLEGSPLTTLGPVSLVYDARDVLNKKQMGIVRSQSTKINTVMILCPIFSGYEK